MDYKNKAIQENRKARKKEKVWRVFAAVSAVVVFFATLTGLHGWASKFRKPDITVEKGLEIRTLAQTDQRFKNIYPLFNDVIDDIDYKIPNNCVTQLIVENHFDQPIALNKIKYKASQIIVDKNPKISANLCDMENNSGIMLKVENHGWGKAKNVDIDLEVVGGDFERFFDRNKLHTKISELEVGETKEVPLLTMKIL